MTSRRSFLLAAAAAAPALRVAPFRVDITPPVGGTLFNNVRARSIVDPLWALGVVLLPPGQGELPVVITALDWCELRNGTYDGWRQALADAAGTGRERVLLSCVHQHDAPYVDDEAQRMLEAAGSPPGRICEPDFNAAMRQRVASAVASALAGARRVTHIGTGQGRVEQVASNRRYVLPDGKVSYGRTSATRDATVRNMPEGLIDPWLKTVSFWDGGDCVAALHCYSTHPMSYYGQGDVSADFVGMARARMQAAAPGAQHVYLTGCAGDTMAGRYNDGNPANRAVLAGRMFDGMMAAWQATRRHGAPARLGFANTALRLPPRRTPGFAEAEQRAKLADLTQSYRVRSEAALALSWLGRQAQPVDVPAVDLGAAQIVQLPAEAFVQYQLWAQAEGRRGAMVLAPGFGECAPGYSPTARDAADGYDDHYGWADLAGSEAPMRAAIRAALRPRR
ncbi:MAG: hypothetical protein IT162_01465 [Bryobacterales bacterium]|nr:hypothetical protein [Bryobacterales bacterium]